MIANATIKLKITGQNFVNSSKILGPNDHDEATLEPSNILRAATRKHTMVGQKEFKRRGANVRLAGKNVLNIIK